VAKETITKAKAYASTIQELNMAHDFFQEVK
jgi:hypothetical protein